jgi:hypothetical protein
MAVYRKSQVATIEVFTLFKNGNWSSQTVELEFTQTLSDLHIMINGEGVAMQRTPKHLTGQVRLHVAHPATIKRVWTLEDKDGYIRDLTPEEEHKSVMELAKEHIAQKYSQKVTA